MEQSAHRQSALDGMRGVAALTVFAIHLWIYQLPNTLDLRRDTGFTPTSFRGQSTGFEFYLKPAADILSSYSHIVPKVGSRDKCATFRWGGDMAECGAALSAAADSPAEQRWRDRLSPRRASSPRDRLDD